jgi:hypothetical protein
MKNVHIDRIFLALHTRDEQDADSSENVRLFSGGAEIVNFNLPPPPCGKVKLLEATASLSYPEVLDEPLFIGLSGVDKWGPRSAFLWGGISNGIDSQIEYIPLAENRTDMPYLWVSQDLQQGVDRWPLRRLYYLDWSDALTGFVLFIETAAAPRLKDTLWLFDQAVQRGLENVGVKIHPKSVKHLMTAIEKAEFVPLLDVDPGTIGPIELSVYCENAAYKRENGWSGSLMFQTTLMRRGRQEPAASGESYLANFEGDFLNYRADVYRSASLTNHSDDPWKPHRIWLFGRGGYFGGHARLLEVYDSGQFWYGQNPVISEKVRASQSVCLGRRRSSLDYE